MAISLLGLGSAALDYSVAVKAKTQLSKLVNSQPEVKANVAYYQANASSVKSVDDLLNNRKLLTVALGAYGLESQVNAKALLRKLLSEDPTASTSLASRMADNRYKSFATAFASLRSDGGAAIGHANSISKVVAAYQASQYEKAIGRNDTAARQALYFARNAAAATGSVYQVLTDTTLGAVVRGAYGLPKETAALDVKAQVRQLQAHGFDYTKLADATYVKSLINKFLANQDAAGTPSGSDEDAVVTASASAATATLTNTVASLAQNNGIQALDLSFLSRGRFNILT